jgi:arylsulfatase A-like enzyme
MPNIKPQLILLGLLIMMGCAPAKNEAATISPIKAPQATPMPPTIFDIDVDQPASADRLDDNRPNIIFILTDDQPYHTINYMPTVKNELMKNGVVFDQGFVTTPLCCPSRVTILTGQYSHNHQVYTNEWPQGGAAKFNDESSIATWLQQSGYQTGYYGKYLNEYDALKPEGRVPPGWSDWKVLLHRKPEYGYFFDFSLSENGQIVEYPKNKANFSADVITRNAVDFINCNKDKPFFLFLGYYNPHSPYISAPRHKDTFRANTGWDWEQHRPPNFNEEDVSDKPQYMRDTIVATDANTIDTAEKQILRSLLSVDDGVASVLNILQKTGLDKKTIIVYLSDNGTTVGEHRFGIDKNCPYEACIQVPFIFYAPWLYAPRTESKMVANIDLAPTFAYLAGIKIPETVDGISLLPLLENPQTNWRDELLFEHWPAIEGVGQMVPEFKAVRTPEWKYVEYTTGECELYNLKNDPYELANVCNQPNFATTQQELKQRLETLEKQ